MREVLKVSIRAREKRLVAFRRFVADWAQRGYQIEEGPSPGLTCATARVPLEDKRWRRDVARGVKSAILTEDWSADWIEQAYTEEEVASAPLFTLGGGVRDGRDDDGGESGERSHGSSMAGGAAMGTKTRVRSKAPDPVPPIWRLIWRLDKYIVMRYIGR